MSDLVEKVAREMCIANGGWPDEDMPNDGPRWKYWVPNARAAIAAVAEWLDNDVSGAAAHVTAHNLRSALRAAAGSATPEVK